MKSKVILAGSLVLALGAGFLAGAYRERQAYDYFFMRSVYRQGALETEHLVRVLTYLREGRQSDALSTLETLLDSSLTIFVRYDEATPSERDDSVLRAIRSARDYRQRHPWKQSDTDMQRILSLAK
jgi:hypothetical protein